jgi:hypothetical protein
MSFVSIATMRPESGQRTGIDLARWKGIAVAMRRGTFLTALLSCALCAPLSAQQNTGQGSPKQCSSSQGGLGVAISSCVYTLEASPAGNPDYYVNVTIVYTNSVPGGAVRFRCDLAGKTKTVPQYGVSRSSPLTLRFISPFVASAPGLESVVCVVDATSAPQ